MLRCVTGLSKRSCVLAEGGKVGQNAFLQGGPWQEVMRMMWKGNHAEQV